jgi:SAM-dependent methyltransferase
MTLLRIVFRALSAARWKIRCAVLSVFCDVLTRWGDKIGVSGNFRARMFWKAGRRDIVPIRVLHEYLSQKRPAGHYYLEAPKWSARSQTIINILSPFMTEEDLILEIGCNLGRNLHHLWQAGYKLVRGMEISEHAVRRLRMEYPCLVGVPVEIGPAEVSIQKCPAKSIDIIFTMATLEHVHPDSRFLFKEIARVARKYVLAIEPRNGKRSHMQYPWNIKDEFTCVGLSWIDTRPWSALWAGELSQDNGWTDDLQEYDAFLFKVN